MQTRMTSARHASGCMEDYLFVDPNEAQKEREGEGSQRHVLGRVKTQGRMPKNAATCDSLTRDEEAGLKHETLQWHGQVKTRRCWSQKTQLAWALKQDNLKSRPNPKARAFTSLETAHGVCKEGALHKQ